MKKTIIYGICTIFVSVALIVSLIFVFGGESLKTQTEKFDLSGTWLIVAVYENDIPTFTEKQFMVFTETNASMYKDDLSKVYASSSYVINDNNQLTLQDISRVYRIDKKTGHCIRLYESSTKYLLLIKNSTSDLAVATFTADTLNGKWNINMKGDQINNSDVLEFEGNSLNYYKDVNAEPTASASFTLSENGVLSAEDLNMTMKCYMVSKSTFVLVEQSGIVWEITKTDGQ